MWLSSVHLILVSLQVELHVLALANVGIGEERVARKTIHKAMVQVCKLSMFDMNLFRALFD